MDAMDGVNSMKKLLLMLLIFPLPLLAQVSGGVSLSGGSRYHVLLQADDFELGDTSRWSGANGGATVNTNLAYVRAGKVSMIAAYNIPCCVGGSQGVNVYKRFNSGAFANGVERFYQAGWVYFKTPGGDRDGPMRKLFWNQDTDAGTQNSAALTTNSIAGVISFTYGNNAAAECGVSAVNAFTQVGGVSWDAWTRLKLYVKHNTPGQADGIVRLWVNGSLVGENVSFVTRGSCTEGSKLLAVGWQLNISPGGTGLEDRYWDEVSFSQSDPE